MSMKLGVSGKNSTGRFSFVESSLTTKWTSPPVVGPFSTEETWTIQLSELFLGEVNFPLFLPLNSQRWASIFSSLLRRIAAPLGFGWAVITSRTFEMTKFTLSSAFLWYSNSEYFVEFSYFSSDLKVWCPFLRPCGYERGILLLSRKLFAFRFLRDFLRRDLSYLEPRNQDQTWFFCNWERRLPKGNCRLNFLMWLAFRWWQSLDVVALFWLKVGITILLSFPVHFSWDFWKRKNEIWKELFFWFYDCIGAIWFNEKFYYFCRSLANLFQRIVTNSSAAVGWMATQESKSAWRKWIRKYVFGHSPFLFFSNLCRTHFHGNTKSL